MALLAHSLALLAMTVATVAFLAPPKVSPLDMARDSFDDQYQGCVPAMNAKLPDLYSFERQMNLLFARGWYEAQTEWQRRGSPVSPLASPWHAVALMAYTSQDVHKEFNKAVQVAGHSRQEYIKHFHFKTLHFLLTQALVTLRHAQNAQCYNVFRGVRNIRFQARRGQRVRFGQFASTSLSEPVALQFGTDTIFKVHTCHGADIRQFSMFPGEEEVLIPPYETFEVTDVTRDGKMTWISLHSTGTSSKYNCALL